MWESAVSGMENAHNCAPKLQVYPPIFSLTPKASGSTRLQSCEDRVFNSQYPSQQLFSELLPTGVQKGVRWIELDGQKITGNQIPLIPGKKEYHVIVQMG